MAQAWHCAQPKSETKQASSTLAVSAGISGSVGQIADSSQHAFTLTIYCGIAVAFAVGQMDQVLNATLDFTLDGGANIKNGHHAMKITGAGADVTASSTSKVDMKTGPVGVDTLVIGTFQSKAAIQSKIPGIEING